MTDSDPLERINNWQRVLNQNRRHLVHCLSIDESVLDELISEELITSIEEDTVIADRTQAGRNRKFAKILGQKKPADVRRIAQVLHKCGKTATAEGLAQLVTNYFHQYEAQTYKS